jgi:hypothetical protein
MACPRGEDCTHRREVSNLSLIDTAWCARFPPELGARLPELLATPDG